MIRVDAAHLAVVRPTADRGGFEPRRDRRVRVAAAVAGAGARHARRVETPALRAVAVAVVVARRRRRRKSARSDGFCREARGRRGDGGIPLSVVAVPTRRQVRPVPRGDARR